MKINEKNLISFSLCDSPVDKSGFLLKRGEVNKSFQKRWFILKGNLLFYFDKKTDKEPIGVIILEGCTIELAENEEQYAFKVVFHGSGNRTYVLCAGSQEEMEGWMKALACASYDYVKLMVAELQRQLDELAETERLNARSRSGSQASLTEGLRRINPFDRYKCQATGSADLASVKNIEGADQASVAAKPELLPKVLAPKVNFLDLHSKYGEKISQDLAKWKEKRMQNDAVDIIVDV